MADMRAIYNHPDLVNSYHGSLANGDFFYNSSCAAENNPTGD